MPTVGFTVSPLPSRTPIVDHVHLDDPSQAAIMMLTSMSTYRSPDAEGSLHHAPKHPEEQSDHRQPARRSTVAEGRGDSRPPRRVRQERVRGDRIPRGTHLRHRQACRHVSRQLLPLLRFEGTDLPRGRRDAGGPAHRPGRRRRTRRRHHRVRPNPACQSALLRALPRQRPDHGRHRGGLALRPPRERRPHTPTEALRRASRRLRSDGSRPTESPISTSIPRSPRWRSAR